MSANVLPLKSKDGYDIPIYPEINEFTDKYGNINSLTALTYIMRRATKNGDTQTHREFFSRQIEEGLAHINQTGLTNAQRSDVIHGLYEALKHGDSKHQMWLYDAIYAYFHNQPIPPVVK